MLIAFVSDAKNEIKLQYTICILCHYYRTRTEKAKF